MSRLIALIIGLFGKWLNKTPPVAPIAEKLGKAEVERDNAQAGEQAIGAAQQASSAVLRDAVDHPDSLREPSPDSRD